MHDESSRSHVFLKMELVTNRLINARQELWDAEGALVPHGKAKDELFIEFNDKKIYWYKEKGLHQYHQNTENGEWEENKDYDPSEDQKRLDAVQKPFDIYQRKLKEKQDLVKKILMENSDKCIGGTMVFVDLAGNEWGSDSKKIKGDTGIQARERQEINKSLLSLKECVRALHLHKDHVPYRDSKLTMVLRPHLKGINSTAIMIANISPSQNHIQKTYNTLLYSQLVAKA